VTTEQDYLSPRIVAGRFRAAQPQLRDLNVDSSGNLFVSVISGGGAAGSPDSFSFTYRFDPDTSRPIYIGRALPGSSDSDPLSVAWTIFQLNYVSSTSSNILSIKQASGVAWANRATVVYQ
jgi:hypothetical protein